MIMGCGDLLQNDEILKIDLKLIEIKGKRDMVSVIDSKNIDNNEVAE
jgi:hypothetical protein